KTFDRSANISGVGVLEMLGEKENPIFVSGYNNCYLSEFFRNNYSLGYERDSKIKDIIRYANFDNICGGFHITIGDFLIEDSNFSNVYEVAIEIAFNDSNVEILRNKIEDSKMAMRF